MNFWERHSVTELLVTVVFVTVVVIAVLAVAGDMIARSRCRTMGHFYVEAQCLDLQTNRTVNVWEAK